VRFLGRKVFLGAFVVLITAMRQGPTPHGTRELRRLLGVSRRTITRWQSFWRELVSTAFWKIARGRFMPTLCETELPRELADRFGASRSLEALGRLLRFLTPLSVQMRTLSAGRSSPAENVPWPLLPS
jgi:hypothetical protein